MTMTYVEQAIQLAIKGGWRGRGMSADGKNYSIYEYEAFLSPLFWQSLGKAEGWDKEVNAGCCEICGEPMPENETMFRYHGYSGDCPKPPIRMKNWKKEWHDFIDHLIAGKSAESFFESLINVKG